MTSVPVLCRQDIPLPPTMMTLDLPHAPTDDGRYLLCINESEPLLFPTRDAALSHAVKLARQRQQQGLDFAINLEGGDGKWRLFQGIARLCA